MRRGGPRENQGDNQPVAFTLADDGRDRVWAELKERYPFFADHEAQAGRVIPVVALERT